MLKRTIKTISLLVAAASIVSMVPAMATDSKKVEAQEGTLPSVNDSVNDSVKDSLTNNPIKKIEAQEGTIYNAKELELGIYCVDAELNGEDEAIYIWKNGKFTKLENAEPNGEIDGQQVYEGTKYIRFANGDCIDEVTGKEFDGGDVKELISYDFGMNLKKKIRKDNDGRFAESNYTDNCVKPIKDIGLGNVFYYTLKKAKANGDTMSAIYTDMSGNYIDGDYNLGRVGVVTTGASVEINGKEVELKSTVTNIKNTEDTYEIEGIADGAEKTYVLKAAITTAPPVGGTDTGGVYDSHCGTMIDNYTKSGVIRTAKLSIWIKENGADDSEYVNITDKVEFGSKNNHHSVPIKGTDENKYAEVMQKILREQASGTIDGIKYSKEVSTYFETDSDGKEYSSDEFLPIKSAYASYNITYDNGFKFQAQSIYLKVKNGYNYLEVSDVDEVDIDSGDSIDWDGWTGYGCLSDGYYEVFNPFTEKFEKKYKFDGSMNRVTSTMATDVIAWNTDSECYTITSSPTSTQSNTAAAETTGATTTTDAAVKIGWLKNIDGTWSNIKVDGTKATGWLKDGNFWYYLNIDGIMATSWQNIGGTWYYLNKSGEMQTGWIDDKGTWYYCNASGAMLSNTTVDGYVLGANGGWVK